MSSTYHLQSLPGLKPQAFVTRLEVKSLFRRRSRILSGIFGASPTVIRSRRTKVTTTDANQLIGRDYFPASYWQTPH